MIQMTDDVVANAPAWPVRCRSGTSLTVALCTHNHKDRLQHTLRALSRLEPPDSPWELLLVDNACTDGTTELVAATDWRVPDIEVRVLREEKLGLSNARNRAIQDATGEYIVFMDDDETPDPSWLRAFEQVILAERPDALGGRIEVMFEDGKRPPWLQDELLGFLGKLDHGGVARRLTEPATSIFGGNFAFRRDTFARIGAFDTALGRKGAANVGGEDTEIYRRLIGAGCVVWWVPDAVIYHRIQATKLTRSYFLDLHFQQGYIEGSRRRGNRSRLPPAYLFPQLWRALKSVLSQRLSLGRDASLRKEMNVAYFVGVVVGWMYGDAALVP
jgi:glucosyl-dolichyl phosphate glucuronosyltransferase